AHDHSIYCADGRGQSVAIVQMPQNALFVRDCDAETAQAEVRHSLEKIAQIWDEERQVHGVNSASDEGGIVQKRRKRVRDRVTNHTKDLRLAVEGVSAIEMLHFLQRDLSW